MKHLFRFIGSVLFSLCPLVTAFSQNSHDPAIPRAIVSRESPTPASAPASNDAASSSITGRAYWGFDLGLTSSAYSGNQNFVFGMEDPTAVDPFTLNPANDVHTYMPLDNLGTGYGFLVGAKAAVPLSSSLDLEGKLRYLTNYTSRQETHDITLAVDPTTLKPSVTASSDNSYSLLLSNLSFAALLNLRLSEHIYGIGGFEYSSLLSNSIVLHQGLANGATYYYWGTGDRSTGSLSDHPASSESAYFTSSRASVQLGAGTAFALSSGSATMLDAELLVSVPVTSWLTSDGQTSLNTVTTGWYLPAITFPKLWYATLTIGIRFPFSSGAAEIASDEAASHAANPVSATPAIGEDGKVALQGRVSDAKTGAPVDAEMTVIDLTNNESVATGHTDPDGKYNIRVRAPGKYSVTAEANGYLFGTSYFEVDKQGRILATHPDIVLSKSSGGKTRLLVFFEFGKTDLSPSSYPELDRAVRLMKAVPDMTVEIAGYTDSIGSPDYNRELSLRRASAVRNYLLNKGITKSRVVAHGYGLQSPIADNATEEGRAENRRVEFVVTNK